MDERALQAPSGARPGVGDRPHDGNDLPHRFPDGRPFLPAARPVLAAGAEAEVLVMAYHAAAAGGRLEARVLDRTGAEVGPGALSALALGAEDETGLARGTARLRSAGLVPGEYLLELRLVGLAGGETLTRSAPFLVAIPAR